MGPPVQSWPKPTEVRPYNSGNDQVRLGPAIHRRTDLCRGSAPQAAGFSRREIDDGEPELGDR
ncbi:hypothetical protein ACVWWO_001930 [Bradyrhizobium sp. F1.13.1]